MAKIYESIFRFLFLIIFSLMLQFCTSQLEKIKQEEIKVEGNSVKKADDSLSNELLKKFPSAINIDSFKYSFTYLLQEKLEKVSNLLYLHNDLFITDIEKYSGDFIITTGNYDLFPKIVGRFLVDSQTLRRLLQEVSPNQFLADLSLIVRVSEIIPIQIEAVVDVDRSFYSDDKISVHNLPNYTVIKLEPNPLRCYLIKGKLVDFYVPQRNSKKP